jgi:hypothetical protein
MEQRLQHSSHHHKASSPETASTPKNFKENVDQALAGSFPNSYRIPGTDISFGWIGFMKADFIYDADVAGTGYGYYATFAPNIPVSGTEQHDRRGEFKFTARQSNIGFRTATPIADGEFQLLFDGDFYGLTSQAGAEQSISGNDFSIRSFYGKWITPSKKHEWLFGQDYTAFQNNGAYAEYVDYQGSTGINWVRQTQLRYTYYIEPNLKVFGSIENPEHTYLEKDGSTITARDTRNGQLTAAERGFGLDGLPDFVIGTTLEGKMGHVSLRGLFRQLRVKTGTEKRVRENAHGLGFTGHINVTEGGDRLLWQVSYGRGIGRYVSEGVNYDAVYNLQKNSLKTLTLVGGCLAYEHRWTPTVRSTYAYGMTHISLPPELRVTGQEINKNMHSQHINLIWSPLKHMDTGIEYAKVDRTLYDGRNGKLNRVQFMVMYKF